MLPSRSELALGTFAAYSPRGTSDNSIKSRQVRDIVKYVRRPLFEQFLDELARAMQEYRLFDVLGPDVIVVPMPRSAPLVTGGLWPSREIADGLVARQLAAEVCPMLRRATPVPKSAFAKAGERPTPEIHYDSLACDPALLTGHRITLIDDVVTKGATMAAGAWRVAEKLPGATVAAFGLLRTMGLQPEVDDIIDPRGGVIVATPWASDRRDAERLR